jgi:flagellar hook capping protein FlgD
MRLGRFAQVLAWMCMSIALPIAAGSQGLRPRNLLVYYGYPSYINQSSSVASAALEFGRYDYVMWGEGLEDPAHPDHANSAAILAHEATAGTRFYGYVDLGVSTQNLPLGEIQARISRWDALGVGGVHFDHFGYDFETSRERQNAAVDFAHSLGLAVIVNAFRPEDAFSSATDPVHNPTGSATRLGPSDYYFYESHGVRLGQFEDGGAWRARSDVLDSLRASLGFHVLSSTTTATDDPNAYDQTAFHYAWYAALLYGHEATGWGEYSYSASGNSNATAPFRARPGLDPGGAFVGPVQHAGSLHTRQTDGGSLELDSSTHAYDFTPNLVDAPGGCGGQIRALDAFPNPSPGRIHFGFTLERANDLRLSVYDAVGRRVSTLHSRGLAAGRHELTWSGMDAEGVRLAAGSYFAVLESGGTRAVSRFVIDR